MYISDSEQLLQYSRELVCLYYVECTMPALNRALVAGRQSHSYSTMVQNILISCIAFFLKNQNFYNLIATDAME